MSSNIKIDKICIFCGEKFVAKTFSTQYCSHRCNQRDYKQKVKEEKIQRSKEEFNIEVKLQKIKAVSIEEVQTKTYLTIREVC